MGLRQAQGIEGTSALAPAGYLEEEFEKDCWDLRLIPAVHYAPHKNEYYLNFLSVPETFRPLVKDFLHYKIASGKTASTLRRCVYCLGTFFLFLVQRYPCISTLQMLGMKDIDAFILSLRAWVKTRGLKDGVQHIQHHLLYLEEFLQYLERIEHPLKPQIPTSRIIWPQHYPKRESRRSLSPAALPETVLQQLDAHLQHLSPTYIPIVTLLRASGWRIADVLYLKLDGCLEQEEQHYWLVGDIMKTRVLGHRIPITKEVAAVVLAQMEWVRRQYTPEENPKKWLFPASKRWSTNPRLARGDPLSISGVYDALNTLVAKYHIRDEQGELFHFRLHAFRHTKGVELVNNGMSLTMVQQWMAHASPEMTIIYAKILDETMRAQWEKTVQQGIVQFHDGKPAYVTGRTILSVLNEPSAFDPERVRDYRHNTRLPVGNCVKPPKLLCKFTELPCFHCPAYVLTPEDLPALEAYERQLLDRIEVGKQANNSYWIEINRKNLEERVRPAIAMLTQGRVLAKSQKYEREYTPEEWQQRQQDKQTEEDA